MKHRVWRRGDMALKSIQGLFFIRPLLSSTGNIDCFPNTETDTEKQNKKGEEYVPNKRT